MNTDDDRRSPLPAYVCREDAARQDALYRATYTKAQQELGQRLHTRAVAAYNAQVYMNFRQRFIAVKVERPKRIEKSSKLALELDKFAAANGFTRHTLGPNVVFRLRK